MDGHNTMTNSVTAQAFTAAQIAKALGKFPQVLRRWLKGVRPDGSRVERRKLAAVWSVGSLPPSVQEGLETKRRESGLNTIEELFAQQPQWQPEFPWNEVCIEHQKDALRLQRALLPVIERRKNALLSEQELCEIGLRQYRSEFQKDISQEQWRYLFARTIERDRGHEQFHRVEIFLPGNLRRAAPAAPKPGKEFEALNLCLLQIRDFKNVTVDEVDAIWMEVVEIFNELARVQKPKKVKRRLLEFLWVRASFLAKSPNAMRVSFDRKIKAARGGNVGLLDGRALKRGERRAPEIPQADIDLISGHSAYKCGTRTAQAARELGQAGECSGLSDGTLALINNPHKSKSHVNRRLFNVVHREAKMIESFLLGKKAIDDATPALTRDYSRMHSMDSVTMDDFTFPVYMFVPDGKGWWILTRGQCLLSVDCRSWRILAWSLQPERNYNSLVIRTLMNHTARQHGLPHEWYFEKGIWQTSKVVKGLSREWNAAKSELELRPGWEKLGVAFTHAKKARAKIVERVGGLVQDLMERCPGYCGRNEKVDCPEVTKRNILAVNARRVEPHGLFYSFDAWHDELGRLIEIYNSEPRQGRVHNGLSADSAFKQFWPHNNPPAKFGPDCWHLLAHYVSEREVGVDGIKFTIGNERYIYRDENSSSLRWQRVLAWFDPECPELLGVTDLSGRNPRLVQRAYPVDFRAASDMDGESGKQYQDELAKVAGHNSYPKARYKIVKALFEQTFRGNIVAPGTAHVAETFQAAREQIRNKEEGKLQRVNATTKLAQRLGLRPGAVRPGDDRAAHGAEMMAEAERKMMAEAERIEKGKNK